MLSTFTKSNKDIEEVLTEHGFTLFDSIYIAKIKDGVWVTVDNDYSVFVWKLIEGAAITDDQFVEWMTGCGDDYEKLRRLCDSSEKTLAFALGVAVPEDYEDENYDMF